MGRGRWGNEELGSTPCFNSDCRGLCRVLEHDSRRCRESRSCPGLWWGSQRLFQVKSSAGHEARLVSLKVPLQLIPGAALGVNLRLLPPDCVSLILGYFVSKRENAPFGWLGQLNEGLTHTGWRKWKLFLVTITRNEYSETSRGNYTNNNVK